MKKKQLIMLLLCLTLATIRIFSEAIPLPATQAFQLNIKQNNNSLLLSFSMKPSYHLYKKSISVINQNGQTLQPKTWPNPSYHTYPEFGKMAIYQSSLALTIPLTRSTKHVTIHYQGCSSAGFCYPPLQKTFLIKNTIAYNSNHHQSFWHLGIFLLYGLLIAFTPCVLPMIPILSAIIAGQKQLNPSKGLILAISYVLGMACSYATIGLVFALLGKNLQLYLQHPWAIILMSLLFVLMALALFDVFQLQLPSKWQGKWQNRAYPTGIGSIFIMGFASTLILSPCVTPALVGALALISQSGYIFQGMLALFLMGIGIGLPLLIISTFGAHFLPKCGKWMCYIKQSLGFIMLAVALWNLSKVLSIAIIMLAYAIWVILIGIWLCRILRRQLIVLITIATITLGLSAYLINRGIQEGWNTKTEATRQQQSPSLDFVSIKNVKQLQQLTQAALANHQPVMIDYQANWCIACHEMQHQTFTDLAVRQFFQPWERLQIDLSANDATARALMKAHRIIAPPSLVLIKKGTNGIVTHTIVGKQSAKSLLSIAHKWLE